MLYKKRQKFAVVLLNTAFYSDESFADKNTLLAVES